MMMKSLHAVISAMGALDVLRDEAILSIGLSSLLIASTLLLVPTTIGRMSAIRSGLDEEMRVFNEIQVLKTV